MGICATKPHLRFNAFLPFTRDCGKLGTYHIGISWDGVYRTAESRRVSIKIPTDLLEKVQIDFSAFPIEIDHRTEMILRKAYLLANDREITSPDLIRQL